MKKYLKLSLALLALAAVSGSSLYFLKVKNDSESNQVKQASDTAKEADIPVMPNALNGGDLSDIEKIEAEFQNERAKKNSANNLSTEVIDNPPPSNTQNAPTLPKTKEGWAEYDRQADERRKAYQESRNTVQLEIVALPRPNNQLAAKFKLFSFGDIVTVFNCNDYDLGSIVKIICTDKKAAIAHLNMIYAFSSTYTVSNPFIRTNLTSPESILAKSNDAFELIKNSEIYVNRMKAIEKFAIENPNEQKLNFK